MKLRGKICLSVSAFLIILLIAVFVLIKNANLIVKNKLEDALRGFSVERIELNWGSVGAFNIAFKKPDGKLVFRADNISLYLDLKGIFKKEYNLSSLTLKNPYLLIEIDRYGKYANPFTKEEDKPSGQMPQISIKQFKVHGGSIDYSDGKVSSAPFITKLRNIEFEIDNISIPLNDESSSFSVEAQIPGNQKTGNIKSSGKISLKSNDLGCQVVLKNLDITQFKHYYQKKDDANITQGSLDLDIKANVKTGIINAPGRATIRGLEFESGDGFKDKFLGVPRAAVINQLKNSNDEITFDFMLEGNIKNPRFNIRESFVEKFTIGLAGKLGISVKKIGETVVVGGAKQVEKGAKGIGEGLKKIFQ